MMKRRCQSSYRFFLDRLVKQACFTALAVMLCLLVLSGCTPDNTPTSQTFSGPLTITPLGDDATSCEYTDESLLVLLNYVGEWMTGVPEGEYSYGFTVNGIALQYDSVNGVFANNADNRYLRLDEAYRNQVNALLEMLFATGEDEINGFLELVYCGNKGKAVILKDEAVYSELVRLISQAKGTQGESSRGYYGVPYTLSLYQKGESKPLVFYLWSQTQYSTSEVKDSEGYPFFFQEDVSALYDYLVQHYPQEFWYPEEAK